MTISNRCSLLPLLCLPLLAPAPAADPPPVPGPLPVKIAGDWSLRVGPGRIERDGRAMVLTEAVVLAVAPAVTVLVRDEKHERLPLFNPAAGGWGYRRRPRSRGVGGPALGCGGSRPRSAPRRACSIRGA